MVDRNPMTVHALENSYTIKCGKSSLALHQDGSIVLRGDIIKKSGDTVRHAGTSNYRSAPCDYYPQDKSKLQHPEINKMKHIEQAAISTGI